MWWPFKNKIKLYCKDCRFWGVDCCDFRIKKEFKDPITGIDKVFYDIPDSFLPWYAVHKDFNRRNNCKYYESKEV